jgi:hypothetical protein
MKEDRGTLRRRVGLILTYMRADDPTMFGHAPVNADGARVIVPCLPDDTVHFACDMVRQSGGEGLVVAVTLASDRIEIQEAHVSCAPNPHKGDDTDVPVGPDCTVADIFSVMAPGASMTISLKGGELRIQDLEAKRDFDGDTTALVG